MSASNSDKSALPTFSNSLSTIYVVGTKTNILVKFDTHAVCELAPINFNQVSNEGLIPRNI
jgi:hypothetical protein